MSIRRNETLVIYPTPEELADEFTNMDDEHQAQFMNAVALAAEHYGFQWCFQLDAIARHPALSVEARAWMRELGEYADEYRIPDPLHEEDITELKEFLQHWATDGHLQTFADRERFRAEALKLLGEST